MNLHLTNYQDNIGCIKSSWVFNYLPSRNIVVLLFRKKKLVSDNSLTFKICFICACPCYGIRDTIKTICPRRAKAGFLKTIQLHFLEMFLLVIVSYSFLFLQKLNDTSSSRSATERSAAQKGKQAQPVQRRGEARRQLTKSLK